VVRCPGSGPRAAKAGVRPLLYVRQDGLKRIGTVVLRNGQLGTDVTAKIQEGGWQFKTTNAAWVWPRTKPCPKCGGRMKKGDLLACWD
jgi:hypothetical protein